MTTLHSTEPLLLFHPRRHHQLYPISLPPPSSPRLLPSGTIILLQPAQQDTGLQGLATGLPAPPQIHLRTRETNKRLEQIRKGLRACVCVVSVSCVCGLVLSASAPASVVGLRCCLVPRETLRRKDIPDDLSLSEYPQDYLFDTLYLLQYLDLLDTLSSTHPLYTPINQSTRQ